MASISSPPSGSRTESTLPKTELTSDEADWHASRFRASWEPPVPMEVARAEPTPAPSTAPEDEDRADPIELRRVTSSAPPPRRPVPPPAAPLDTLPPAPAASAADPSVPAPVPPVAVGPAERELVVPAAAPAAVPTAVPAAAPAAVPTAVPAVVPERDFVNDSVDLPLRTGSALRLPLWIGAGALVLFAFGGVLWALTSEDGEAAPGAVASMPRVEEVVADPVAAPERSEPSPSPEPVASSPDLAEETEVAEVTPAEVPSEAEEPPAPETVSVSLRVTPRLSRVEVDGELWRAPFRQSLTRSENVRRVVVSRRGYATVERELAGDQDHDVTIRLRRGRPRPQAAPRATTTTGRPAVVRRPPPSPRRSPAKRPRRRRLGAGFTTSNPY